MEAKDQPIVGGRADEFMARYAADIGISVGQLREWGREPFYCSGCSDYDYPHWEMGRVTDDAFDRRNEIEPPV